jgi:hypothetical protein
MMKKRKFGSGGMPSMKESMESGNRVSRQVGAETKKLMPATRSTRPSVGDAIASGNRMSKKNAEDLKAVKKYAKGGKVKKRYADGDLVMGDAASDTSGLSLGMPSIDTDLRRALTDKELMDANLAAVRAREAASMAKPKPKPKRRAETPVKKPETPVKKPETPVKKPETPANPPAGKPMRVGSESASAAREGLRRGARASGETIKTVARGVGSAPRRAAAALESANEQTKTQSRNMAKLREKNPNLVDRFIKMLFHGIRVWPRAAPSPSALTASPPRARPRGRWSDG